MFQLGVGCREIENTLFPSSADSIQHTLSLSNCGELYAHFQFKSWQGSTPTPGRRNDCFGGSSHNIEESDDC